MTHVPVVGPTRTGTPAIAAFSFCPRDPNPSRFRSVPSFPGSPGMTVAGPKGHRFEECPLGSAWRGHRVTARI